MGDISPIVNQGLRSKWLTSAQKPATGLMPLLVDSNGDVVPPDTLPTANPRDGSWWLNGGALTLSRVIDDNAADFLDATGISNDTIVNAIDNLVVAWKAHLKAENRS